VNNQTSNSNRPNILYNSERPNGIHYTKRPHSHRSQSYFLLRRRSRRLRCRQA